jgi:hypothetical protein
MSTNIIKEVNFSNLGLIIEGTAPLVIARFSKKAELMAKMSEGKSASSKKERKARDYDAEVESAKYFNLDKSWEGFNASAVRAAMISACRLIGFKMTLAKLSVFVVQDAFDFEGTPLVRIYGKAVTHTAHTRNATGVVDVRARPMYQEWAARLHIRFDADQFTTMDVVNLLDRAGQQVGIGEGRPDSKSSAGCGWGTFEVVRDDRREEVSKKYGIAL